MDKKKAIQKEVVPETKPKTKPNADAKKVALLATSLASALLEAAKLQSKDLSSSESQSENGANKLTKVIKKCVDWLFPPSNPNVIVDPIPIVKDDSDSINGVNGENSEALGHHFDHHHKIMEDFVDALKQNNSDSKDPSVTFYLAQDVYLMTDATDFPGNAELELLSTDSNHNSSSEQQPRKPWTWNSYSERSRDNSTKEMDDNDFVHFSHSIHSEVDDDEEMDVESELENDIRFSGDESTEVSSSNSSNCSSCSSESDSSEANSVSEEDDCDIVAVVAPTDADSVNSDNETNLVICDNGSNSNGDDDVSFIKERPVHRPISRSRPIPVTILNKRRRRQILESIANSRNGFAASKTKRKLRDSNQNQDALIRRAVGGNNSSDSDSESVLSDDQENQKWRVKLRAPKLMRVTFASSVTG